MSFLNYPTYLYSGIINIIALFSSKIPSNVRFVVMNITMFCINMLGIIGHCNDGIKGALNFDKNIEAVSTLLLITLLIMSIDKKVSVKRGSYSTVFMLGWYLCFAAIVISAQFHPVKRIYFLWAILSLTIFPMLMIVWNEKESFRYWCQLVAKHMVLASLCFIMINLLIVAFTTNTNYIEGISSEFLGIAPNPNSNGMIVLPFFTSALYLVLTDKRYVLVNLAVITFCIMITLISGTRTAEIAIVLELLIATGIYCRQKNAFRKYIFTRKSLIALIIAIVLAATAGYVLLYLDRLDLSAYAQGEMEEAMTEVSADEKLQKLDKLSSGRIVLWKAYLKTVGFSGNGNSNGPQIDGYAITRWAHNNAIDIWYASGFLAFIGYIIWLISAWGFVIRCMFSDRGFRKEYLLAALAFVGYFVEAMLEITIYPMYTGIVFLAYITMMPIAFKD